MKKQDIRAICITAGATLWFGAMYASLFMLPEQYRPLPFLLTGVAIVSYVAARLTEQRR